MVLVLLFLLAMFILASMLVIMDYLRHKENAEKKGTTVVRKENKVKDLKPNIDDVKELIRINKGRR